MIFKIIKETLLKKKEPDFDDIMKKKKDLPKKLENFLRKTFRCKEPEKFGPGVALFVGLFGLFIVGFGLQTGFLESREHLRTPVSGSILMAIGILWVAHSVLYVVFNKWIKKYQDEARQEILQKAQEESERERIEQEKEDNARCNSVLDGRMKCVDCRYKLAKAFCLSLEGDSSVELFNLMKKVLDSEPVKATPSNPCNNCKYN